MKWFFKRKIKPVIELPLKSSSPPMTAIEFIDKFRRNYVNYAALIEVAFGLGDEMFGEYERLSDSDKNEIVRYAKNWAQKA